jgi:hypothetical protein
MSPQSQMSLGHAFQIATPEFTVTAALRGVRNIATMKCPVHPFTWASSNTESASGGFEIRSNFWAHAGENLRQTWGCRRI